MFSNRTKQILGIVVIVGLVVAAVTAAIVIGVLCL